MINKKVAIVILGTACLLGCNKTEQGASWGAGAGALIGGMIGNDQDKQYQQQQRQSGQTYRFTRTREVLNSDGTVTTVGETTTNSEQTTDGYEGLPQ